MNTCLCSVIMLEYGTPEKDSHLPRIHTGFSTVCRLPWTGLMSMLQPAWAALP